MENDSDSIAADERLTVSHLLGEIAWLLSQSPLHGMLTLSDLNWLIMPPLIHRQFYIFRDGQQPVGLALWARCSETAEAKLEKGPQTIEGRLSLEDWNSGERLWLVELIAPFADEPNQQREIMFADLISGPLSGHAFNFHETDGQTGQRSVRHVPADAGERLRQTIDTALKKGS